MPAQMVTRAARVASFLPLCLLAACLGQTRVTPKASQATAARELPLAEVRASERTPEGIRLVTDRGVLELSSLGADTFRVRLARNADARRLPSFAVTTEDVPTVTTQIEESDATLLLRTEQALLRVDKKPLRLRLMQADGTLLCDQAVQVEWSSASVTLDFGLNQGERVFGLGDKVKGYDRRGHAFELWNTDAYGWKVDADPLYKSLPVWLTLQGGKSRGVFVDSPARARVDVGRARPDVVRYEARGVDALDVYFFAGPEPKRVVSAFTALTGRTPLPPLWALGHHQSRYGYLTEADVRGVVARMAEEKIPLDAVWLDIDYQVENAPFTVNQQAFPRFRDMVSDFAARGVRTVAITDLHVKSYQGKPAAGYAPYESGAAGDHFIHSGSGFFEGPVWPGQSVFPEFTLARSRAWWGSLYRDFVEQGVAGFWNDMNEPALFVKDKTFPEDVAHRLEDGSVASHLAIHNAYGMLNARATYEGLLALRPETRPFVLTRAAYAGTQRYAASWTGDNTADRSHLAVTIPQLLNLGVSGYPLNGADVGGFVGCPDAELFAEWMELGALQPFFRNHSAKESCRREPWLFGSTVLERARKAVERRYRLLPYLYTQLEETSRTGLPVMRPLWLEYPNDAAVYDADSAYLLGPDLLVAPKLVAGTARYRVVLPAADWYDLQTRELVSGGAHEVQAPSRDSVRLYVRAGAIIPQAPVVMSTDEKPKGPLTVEVWPGSRCEGSLYLDDGKSFGFRKGQLLRMSYKCETAPDGLKVEAVANGSFSPWWREQRLVMHAVPRAPKSVSRDGSELPHAYDAATRTLVLTLREPGSFAVQVNW